MARTRTPRPIGGTLIAAAWLVPAAAAQAHIQVSPSAAAPGDPVQFELRGAGRGR